MKIFAEKILNPIDSDIKTKLFSIVNEHIRGEKLINYIKNTMLNRLNGELKANSRKIMHMKSLIGKADEFSDSLDIKSAKLESENDSIAYRLF